jgi:hypothetical protein
VYALNYYLRLKIGGWHGNWVTFLRFVNTYHLWHVVVLFSRTRKWCVFHPGNDGLSAERNFTKTSSLWNVLCYCSRSKRYTFSWQWLTWNTAVAVPASAQLVFNNRCGISRFDRVDSRYHRCKKQLDSRLQHYGRTWIMAAICKAGNVYKFCIDNW